MKKSITNNDTIAFCAYVDGPGKGFYSSDALGDFLNNIYRSFTGKACKEV